MMKHSIEQHVRERERERDPGFGFAVGAILAMCLAAAWPNILQVVLKRVYGERAPVTHETLKGQEARDKGQVGPEEIPWRLLPVLVILLCPLLLSGCLTTAGVKTATREHFPGRGFEVTIISMRW